MATKHKHPMQPILLTQNLTRRFGHFIAVNHLNLEIHAEKIFGLLGPNGAGKSTLIKMLTTLLPPSEGDALIDGISIVKSPRKVRGIIGYVPQMISVDGALTGYENLLFFAKLYNIPSHECKSRVSEALEIMGLSDVAHKLVNHYSGGMMRRLEIIQALLHRPKVLFLDEPTSGLDPIARSTVWHHLKSAHQNFHITILLTSHDMEEVDHLCEEVAIMNHGQIFAVGSTETLKNSIRSDANPTITMGDVFMHYTKQQLVTGGEESHHYQEIQRQRNTEHRRG